MSYDKESNGLFPEKALPLVEELQKELAFQKDMVQQQLRTIQSLTMGLEEKGFSGTSSVLLYMDRMERDQKIAQELLQKSFTLLQQLAGNEEEPSHALGIIERHLKMMKNKADDSNWIWLE